jgi:short-subunit dehydrogenase
MTPTTDGWAVITGASSGIGLELARLMAARGHNLVLLARNQTALEQLAAELRARHGTEVKVLVKDLAHSAAPAEVFDALRDVPVSILVNNAGFGLHGPFATNELRTQTDMMQVNMTSLVELTHRFLKPMIARRHGRILNVASIAAFQPGPTVSVYYASKAFVHSFSYALAAELEGTGVTVTALCPGATRTEFFTRARMPVAHGWVMMHARPVAESGYRGMMKGRRVVIPGLLNRIVAGLSKLSPIRLTSAISRRVHTE